MAVEVWEGTPGSGKTSGCIVSAINHLEFGGVVFSNFRLRDGWAEELASRDIKVRLGLRDKDERAADLYSRWMSVGSLEDIRKGAALIPKLVKGQIAQKFEGHALLLLDEVQLIFNSRKWEKNYEWIEFFTQHRKMGFDVRMIAHSIEMVDSQIRPLVEYRVSLRNTAKLRFPLLGIPLNWFFGGGNVFLAIWRYAGLGGGSGLKVKSQYLRLNKFAASLFDSHLVFNGSFGQTQEGPKLMGPAPASGRGRAPSGALSDQARESLQKVLSEMVKELPGRKKRNLSLESDNTSQGQGVVIEKSNVVPITSHERSESPRLYTSSGNGITLVGQ